VNIHLDVVLSGDVGSVALNEVKQAGSISSGWHDGWFLDPQYFSDLSNAGGMVSLTQFIDETKANGEDPGMHWADILPAITSHVMRYNNKLVGFPLSGDMLMMFYRKDLLDAIKADVPSTWEHVLAISRKIYNQDLGSDGSPKYGMCFDIMPGALQRGGAWHPCASHPVVSAVGPTSYFRASCPVCHRVSRACHNQVRRSGLTAYTMVTTS
jgi:ABC-type glycerol-3-phosphate transport system substrate-binding protein